MKINDLEFSLVEIERSDGGKPVRSLLVCLSTDSRLEGWGEAPVTWRIGEFGQRREALLASYAGRSVFDVEELLRLDVVDDPSLRAALETAIWDLIGKVVGQPIHNLMGGGYRTRIPVVARVPVGSPDETARASRDLIEQGFHTQIVAATGDARQDAQVVRSVLEAAGDQVEIRVDGGGKFAPAAAERFLLDVDDCGVHFLLDPLPPHQWSEMAHLVRRTDVPMAVSAGVRSPRDVMAMARAGAASFLVVSPIRVGGLGAARRCAIVANAAAMSSSLDLRPSAGVAAAAGIQLAASSPCFASGNECDHALLVDDVLVDPLRIVDGMVALPQAPGLGVAVDRAKVERYQVT
jgi:L-alanine-DL-glutamate epimerase-like enolase superfamily enzyme